MNGSARTHLLREMFDGTGPTYDEIVAEATGGADREWKADLIGRIGSPARVLDLACGTGILTFMIRDLFPSAELVGVDRSIEFLSVAIARARSRGDERARFVLGDAETTEVGGSFDAIVSCYLPKYADLPVLVARLGGSLAPAGRLVMQDFLYPEHPDVRRAWERRFDRLRRRAEDGWPEARRMFEILPAVIRESRWVEELPRLLVARGLEGVRVIRQDWGLSALVIARQPSRRP